MSFSEIDQLMASCQAAIEAALGADEGQRSLEEIRRAAHDTPIRVAIVGAFKSGKSTLANAMLGQTLLPTGATPVGRDS